MNRSSRRLVLSTLALLVASSASADRLVTRDGATLETAGPWTVEGRMVVFRLPGGQLSSMRLSHIDLEASAAATSTQQEAARKDDDATAPSAMTAWVLTDEDVRHVQPEATDPREALEPTAVGDAEQSPVREQGVGVTRWTRSSDPNVDGLVLSGELANPTDHVAASIDLTVLLYDREGELLVSRPANLTVISLQPGQSARFRCELPGIFSFSSVKFDVEALLLATSSSSNE